MAKRPFGVTHDTLALLLKRLQIGLGRVLPLPLTLILAISALTSLSRVIAAAPTTTTLSSSSNSTVYGAPVTLTAVVSPAVNAGKVTFYDGVTVLGIANVSAGSAVLVTLALSSGVRPLSAYYSGSGIYVSSKSSVLQQEVRTVAGAAFRMIAEAVSDPAGAAVADFNGDGKADLAVIVYQNVCVLLGKGDGTFDALPCFPPGGTAIAAGDFNGDGKPDLVLGEDQGVAIWLGNGDGTFAGPANYPTRAIPTPLVLGDFNGDGNLDIATGSNGYPVGNSILLGKGDGTFAPAIPFGSDPITTLAIGDFNSDGKTDLAFASLYTGATGILLGNQDGTFATLPIGFSFAYLFVADFNGDGHDDLVGMDYLGFHVLLGKGDATFTALAPALLNSVPSMLNGILIEDFNGDGIPDLGGLAEGLGPIVVATGNGDGTFRPPANSIRLAPIVAADFNGDGIVDVVAASPSALDVYLGVPPVDLALRKTHAGNFLPGQTDATYTLTVDNVGPNATHAPVTVTEMPPNGLTLHGLNGPGWDCTSFPGCTRADSLPAGRASRRSQRSSRSPRVHLEPAPTSPWFRLSAKPIRPTTPPRISRRSYTVRRSR